MRKQEKGSRPVATTQHKRCRKDNHFASQLRITRDYFTAKTASRYMAAIETGIPIQNVCRYVDMLRKQDAIAILRIDKCAISGEYVEFLSCNADLFPKSKQLKLF
ncbi:MAG: hypothetical protein ACOCUL_01300 [Bacteroidota bacterium]